MPLRAWRERIEDIIGAIERIREYTESMDFGAFSGDQKTIDAVVRNLEVIGEASNHIPAQIQKQHPEIPWRDMRDMRNLISHAYFAVDVSVVWETAQQDVPALLPALRAILDETQ